MVSRKFQRELTLLYRGALGNFPTSFSHRGVVARELWEKMSCNVASRPRRAKDRYARAHPPAKEVYPGFSLRAGGKNDRERGLKEWRGRGRVERAGTWIRREKERKKKTWTRGASAASVGRRRGNRPEPGGQYRRGEPFGAAHRDIRTSRVSSIKLVLSNSSRI